MRGSRDRLDRLDRHGWEGASMQMALARHPAFTVVNWRPCTFFLLPTIHESTQLPIACCLLCKVSRQIRRILVSINPWMFKVCQRPSSHRRFQIGEMYERVGFGQYMVKTPLVTDDEVLGCLVIKRGSFQRWICFKTPICVSRPLMITTNSQNKKKKTLVTQYHV